MEIIELINQEKMWTLGKKKNYKNFGILKADIIKHAELKAKVKDITSEEQ